MAKMKLLGICLIFCSLFLPNPTMAANPAEFEKEVAKFNSFLYKMCDYPFVDTIGDNEKNRTIRTEARYNDDKGECKQTYTMVASEEQAKHFCRNAMPMDVSLVKTDGTTVTCVWTKGANCPNNYIQIYDKCYTPKESCGVDDRLASPKQDDHIRWLSRFAETGIIPKDIPLIIKETRLLSAKKVHEKKYFDRGAVVTPSNPSDLNKFKWAMVTVPNRIYGLRPGDIIRANSSWSLCERNAERTEGSREDEIEKQIYPMNKEIKEFGTGSMGSRGTIGLSKGRVFITRNEYLPRLLEEDVDHKYFHEVCASICEKCVAASGQLLTEIGNSRSLPSGFYHVPVARKMVEKGGIDKCKGPKPAALERKKYKALLASKFQSMYTPKESEWFGKNDDKFPYNDCSDGDRFTVQFFQGNGEFGYVDAPAFDRKPIICYDGTLPEQPREDGACYKNSEMVNGKCQCKKGFDEGLDSNMKDILIKRRYTERGYICFEKANCFQKDYKDMQYKGFFYLADGSGTMQGARWSKVRPFAGMFKSLVPNKVPVWIMQWSSPPEYHTGWDCGEGNCPPIHLKLLEPGWSPQQYDQVADEVLGKWQNGWTLPYVFIDEAAKMWIQYKSDHGLKSTDKALMVFVSDGEWQEGVAHGYQWRDYHLKHTQHSWAQANMTFAGANEGANPSTFDHFNKYLNGGVPLRSIQIPPDGSRFDEDLSKELLSIGCTERKEQDIIDAIG